MQTQKRTLSSGLGLGDRLGGCSVSHVDDLAASRLEFKMVQLIVKHTYIATATRNM